MDTSATSKELPPAPSSTEPPSSNKINRIRTTPVNFDVMESSGRSNGRSSIDSTFDRPKSQSGEVADSAKAGSSGFSKLLRRKNKKKNQKLSDEQSTENDRDLPSRDGSEGQNPPESEAGNLLMEESEPDR